MNRSVRYQIQRKLEPESSGVARNFKRGEGHNFRIFSSVFFSGRTKLKVIEKQEVLGESGGMLSGKNIENLRAVIAIYML